MKYKFYMLTVEPVTKLVRYDLSEKSFESYEDALNSLNFRKSNMYWLAGDVVWEDGKVLDRTIGLRDKIGEKLLECEIEGDTNRDWVWIIREKLLKMLPKNTLSTEWQMKVNDALSSADKIVQYHQEFRELLEKELGRLKRVGD